VKVTGVFSQQKLMRTPAGGDSDDTAMDHLPLSIDPAQSNRQRQASERVYITKS
jgi:hypothetical protein